MRKPSLIYLAGPFQTKEQAEAAKKRSRYPKEQLLVEQESGAWVLRLVYIKTIPMLCFSGALRA